MTSAYEVAVWMLEEMRRVGTLYQGTAVYEISRRFGDDFTYHNKNGNLAIKKEVLDAFRGMSGKDVVWSRSERFWRAREANDLPGRSQP